MTQPPAVPAALTAAFRQRFPGAGPVTAAFAPGRVNLIGDHVDYCGGTVLPMPIEQGTWVLAAGNDTGEMRAHSDTVAPDVRFAVGDDPAFASGHWGRFVRGALAALEAQGAEVRGVDLLVHGEVPGNGLSSSASLCVALLLALGGVTGRTPAGLQLALAAQRIEHEHIGVACGLMDQAAIVLGEPDAALAFDCATRRGQPIPLPARDCAVIVADSGVPRALAASAYNERRRSLQAVADTLGLDFHTLATMLPADVHLADPVLARRARHVASEQRRVLDACAAARAGDWPRLGALLDASHASLRDDFEVSCAELDVLVDALRRQPGCHGARLTGAGFGGAAVAIAAPEAAEPCRLNAAADYATRTGRTATTFVARSRGGARHG